MIVLKVLYFLVLLTLPIGQIGRFVISENIAFFITDLLIPILFFSWLIYALGIRKKVFLPPVSLPIIFFSLTALLSLLIGSTRLETSASLVSGLFLLRWLEYASLYFIGYDLFVHNKDYAIRTFKSFQFFCFLVAVFGFFQFLIIPDFSQQAAVGGWDPHQYRLLSTFLDPNFVGGFLVVGLNCVIATLLFKPKRAQWPALVVFGTSLLVAIVLTFSRSTYLAFFTSIFAFASLKSRKLFLGVSLILLVSFLVLPPVQARLVQAVSLDDAARSRIISWQNALQITADNPVFGVGFNTYRFTQERYNFITDKKVHSGSGADSSLLLILATTGIVGLLSYLAIIFGLVKLAFANRTKVFGLAFLVSLAALLVHSQFVNSLLYPQIMEAFWVLAALVASESNKNG